MSNATYNRGKRNPPSRSGNQAESDQRRAQAERLAQARAERQRLVDQRRSEDAAALVALARAERAKRIAAGKPVAPTIDEWREGRRTMFTTMGDLA